MSANVNYHIM